MVVTSVTPAVPGMGKPAAPKSSYAVPGLYFCGAATHPGGGARSADSRAPC